jgi:hypothetical protein
MGLFFIANIIFISFFYLKILEIQIILSNLSQITFLEQKYCPANAG